MQDCAFSRVINKDQNFGDSETTPSPLKFWGYDLSNNKYSFHRLENTTLRLSVSEIGTVERLLKSVVYSVTICLTFFLISTCRHLFISFLFPPTFFKTP